MIGLELGQGRGALPAVTGAVLISVVNWKKSTGENMTVKDVKRSTADEVFALILADLVNAESNLPDVVNLANVWMIVDRIS